jgi:transcription-repair coupling factor (superfamily II helicase)
MVSRETESWTIDQFLYWHKKNILNERFDETVDMSIDALSVVLLSLINASDGFAVVLSPKEADAFLFYSSCYGLCSDLSFFLPGQSMSGVGVSGFITENQRFREEACFVMSRMKKRGLLFSSRDAVDSVLMPTVSDNNKPLKFSINTKIKMSFVVHYLNLWGYIKTDRVVNPLYYSVRGGILDIFPVNSRNPVRVEFFGDTIESIRLFNPYSQRTIKKTNRVMILPRGSERQQKKQPISSFVREKKEIWEWEIKQANPNLYRLKLNKKQHELSWGSYLPFSKKLILSFSENNINKTCFVFSEKNGPLRLPDPFQKPSNIKRVNATIGSGFFLKENVAVLGTNNIPELSVSQKSRWMIDGDGGASHSKILDISDLEWEEPLVHEDFGIGTYRGLEVTSGGECIKLKYADGGAVYVPVASFHKIHRLVGVPDGSIKISSLKTKQWGRKKTAVKQYAESIAGDLLKTYLERQASRGFSYTHNGDLYKAVCESFPYNETKDQLVALKDVILDMKRSVPMDRLICGDVGFGKTEIAIRASIMAIESGKMVFVLAPTTVLANQHFISFCGRFSPLGARVELLSRFRTKREQNGIIELVGNGKIDVLVGTHRLLSDDVNTEGLGLIVIDEEHRFGVKQKEKIKSLKASIDILTLTATPIPRTLKQSLTGMKNISVINTPPKVKKTY